MKQRITEENFLNIFREQFNEDKRGSILMNTKFKKLEDWSSLQSLIVITALDEAFGYVLSVEDLVNSERVEDLFLIMNKIKSQ